MADNKNKSREKEDKISSNKDIIKMNDLFQDIYKKISTSTYEIEREKNKDQIDSISDRIRKVINDDLDEMKTYGGENDLTRFLLNTIQKTNRQITGASNTSSDSELLEKIFLSKDGSIFNTFEERFKNKALLFSDLEMISEQLVELNEAINTTRDDIVAADDVGSEISRSLSFSVEGNESEKYDDMVEDVKFLEKKYGLNYIIREHIIPKTLKYGEYYVYVIPEKDIYESAQRKKQFLTTGTSMPTKEAYSLLESLIVDKNDPVYKDTKPEDVMEYLTENIKVNNGDMPLPLLESNSMVDGMKDLAQFNNLNSILKKKKWDKNDKSKKEDPYNSLGFSDGVKSFRLDDWNGVKGCYIKLLDPKKVIPVKLLDYTIGYYYIHDTELEEGGSSSHQCKHGHRFNSLMDLTTNKAKNQQNIVSSIANAIVQSFDKKYLNDNNEFKELIVNSLLYNDMYRRKLHYQFIPADNICRFSINEDEHGNGQSMLSKSLFYAKLYLSLLVFDMMTYLTKSQDTIVTYVKTSGIDKNVINKTMDVARQWKSKQIGIGDLMDYSSIYSKIGTGRDLFIPEGESGERGLSWDVIQGQDVNMQTELMEMLKQAFINGTGVPSVIMNYINEADFAKTLVMANAKQVRRVMMYQDSFNEDLTELYQKILYYCTDFELEDIANFTYTLMRPKTLPNNNLVDLLGYGEQILDFIEKSEFGQYAEETPELNNLKDSFRQIMSRKVLPMLPWEVVDDILKEIKLSNVENQLSKTSDNNDTPDSEY
jgi:6-pyruvoyl-tetrahydropterin synthase